MVNKLFIFLHLRVSVIIAIMLFVPSVINGASISIVLQDVNSAPYTTWIISPPMALNVSTTMVSSQALKVIINANGKIDLNAAATSTGPWTAGAVAGVNIYKLELKAFPLQQGAPNLSAGTTTILETSTLFDSKQGKGTRWVYAKFSTPTSTTSGQPQMIMVTITATVH